MKKFDVGFVCGFVGKFVEKLVIGKSVDFSWVLIFIQEESGFDYGLRLGCSVELKY